MGIPNMKAIDSDTLELLREQAHEIAKEAAEQEYQETFKDALEKLVSRV
jgi:hypothetical protein